MLWLAGTAGLQALVLFMLWRNTLCHLLCNRKLLEIVNMWLGMNITPAEFVRTKRLGYKTLTSAIKDLNDPVLNEKLAKVIAFAITL